MALTEIEVEDKIEVVGDLKTLQVRLANIVKRDGVEISRTFKRRVLVPSIKTDGVWANTDVSGETSEVQGISAAVWTDAIRTAYQNQVDATLAAYE
tara:strand:+ start:272 stop:559 length:288 start_codon:yes stop_codon:yes gene_type:complete